MGSAISTTMSRISSEVSRGTERGKEWAKVMGMSIEEVQHLFEVDAYGALIKMVEGLEKVDASGGNVDKTLRDLGITEIRQLDVMKRLIGSSGELAEAQKMASEEYANSNELMRESEERYKTFESQMQMLKNGIQNIWANMGGAIAKSSGGIIESITKIIDKIEAMTDAFFDADGNITKTGETFATLVKIITPIVALLGIVGASFLMFGPAGIYALGIVAGLTLVGSTFADLINGLTTNKFESTMESFAKSADDATADTIRSFGKLRSGVKEDLDLLQTQSGDAAEETKNRIVSKFREMHQEIRALNDEEQGKLIAMVEKRMETATGKELEALKQLKTQIIQDYDDLDARLTQHINNIAKDMNNIIDENGTVNKDVLQSVADSAEAVDKIVGTSLGNSLTEMAKYADSLDEVKIKELSKKEIHEQLKAAIAASADSLGDLTKAHEESVAQVEASNASDEVKKDMLNMLGREYYEARKGVYDYMDSLIKVAEEEGANIEVLGELTDEQRKFLGLNNEVKGSLDESAAFFKNSKLGINEFTDGYRRAARTAFDYNKAWEESKDKLAALGEEFESLPKAIEASKDKSSDAAKTLGQAISTSTKDGVRMVDLGKEGEVLMDDFIDGLQTGEYTAEQVGVAVSNKLRGAINLESLKPDGIEKMTGFVEGLQSGETNVKQFAKNLGLSLSEDSKIDLGPSGEVSMKDFVNGLEKGTYGVGELAIGLTNNMMDVLTMDLTEIGKGDMKTLANGLKAGVLSVEDITKTIGSTLEDGAEVELGSQGKFTIGTLVQGLADGKINVDDAMEGMKALIEGKSKIDLTSEARATMDGYVQTISEMTGQPVEAIEDMIEDMYRASGEVDFTTRGLEIPQEISDGVNELAPQLYQTAEEMMNEMINQLDDEDGQAFESGAQVPQEMSEGMQSTFGDVLEQSEQLKGEVQETLGSTDDGGGGEKAGSSFWGGLLGFILPARASAAEISDGTEEVLGGTSDGGGGSKAGSEFIQGIANSLTPAQELVSGAKGSVEETLGSTTDGKGGSHAMGIFAQELISHSATAVTSVDRTIMSIQSALGKTNDGGGGKNAMSKFTSGLSTGGNKGVAIASNTVNRVRSALSKATDGGGGKKAGSTFHKGINSFVGKIRSTSDKIVRNTKNTLSKATDGKGGTKVGREFNRGINSFVGRARSTASRMATGAKNAIRSNSNTYSLGANFGSGFVRGIRSYVGAAVRAAASLARAALNAVRREQRSASPSKETMKLGGDFGDGFAIAIESSSKRVERASRYLVQNAMSELEHGLNVPSVDDIYGSLNGAKVSSDMRANLENATNLELNHVQPAHIKVSVGGQEFETFSRNIYKQNTKRLNLKESYRG